MSSSTPDLRPCDKRARLSNNFCRHNSCEQIFDENSDPDKFNRAQFRHETDVTHPDCNVGSECCLWQKQMQDLRNQEMERYKQRIELFKQGPPRTVTTVINSSVGTPYRSSSSTIPRSRSAIVTPGSSNSSSDSSSCGLTQTPSIKSMSARASLVLDTPSSFPESSSSSASSPMGQTVTMLNLETPFSSIPSLSDEGNALLSGLNWGTVAHIASGALFLHNRIHKRNPIRPYIRSALTEFITDNTTVLNVFSQRSLRKSDGHLFRNLESDTDDDFWKLFYGNGPLQTRESRKQKIMNAAVQFWENESFPSAHKVMSESGKHADQKVPIRYLCVADDILFEKYQEWWISKGLDTKLMEDCLPGKDVEIYENMDDGVKKLEFLRNRKMILTPDSLSDSMPRYCKIIFPQDFACPTCRRANEYDQFASERMKALHSGCEREECLKIPEPGSNEIFRCEVFQRAMIAELEMETADFEAKHGRCAFIDAISAKNERMLHKADVDRQRINGFQQDRDSLVSERSRALLISDFTGMDRFYRFDKTQSEMRLAQHQLLCIAVLFVEDAEVEDNDGKMKMEPVEFIEYFDFLDEHGQDDVAVLRFAMKAVLENLLRRNFRSLSLWTDNCGRQFHSRKPLNSILSELVDELNNSPEIGSKPLQEFCWNFFWPYHGKCLCNSHFGVMKNALQVKLADGFQGFCSTDALKEICERKEHFFVVVPDSLPVVTDVEPIPDTKIYHLFRRKPLQGPLIECFVFSDQKDVIPPPLKHLFQYPKAPSKRKRDQPPPEDSSEKEETFASWMTRTTSSMISSLSSLWDYSDMFVGQPSSFPRKRGEKAVAKKVQPRFGNSHSTENEEK